MDGHQLWRDEKLQAVWTFKESVHHPFLGSVMMQSCSLIIKPGGSFCPATFPALGSAYMSVH